MDQIEVVKTQFHVKKWSFISLTVWPFSVQLALRENPVLPDQDGVSLCYCTEYEVILLAVRLTIVYIITFINAY